MAERKPASPLRIERIKAGWKLGELAEAIDVAESKLYRIETGTIKEPSDRLRRALSKKLGVSASKLFAKTGRGSGVEGG